jgi:hypothetical protein
LIFNSKDKVIINVLLEDNGLKTFKTVVLDINSLNILEKKEEELLAFFK